MQQLERTKELLSLTKTPMIQKLFQENPGFVEKMKDPAFQKKIQALIKDPEKVQQLLQHDPRAKALSNQLAQEKREVEEKQSENDPGAKRDKVLREILSKPDVLNALKDP